MRVCVIGAGPAGLTTIKQLLDEGHEVTCFDKNSDIGGIWYRHDGDSNQMKVFDNMKLTISMKLMAFSDFLYEGGRNFANHVEYWQYLCAYADKFSLRKRIQLNTLVEDIQKQDNIWKVFIDVDGAKTVYEFDAVALCTGPFRSPNIKIPGIENFTGEVFHSGGYRNNHKFIGKKVLVIGLAESGADIVRDISNVASACTLSIRSYVFLLPRIFKGKFATDSATFRAHHYEMWWRATNVPLGMTPIWGQKKLSKWLFLTGTFLYGMITYLFFRLTGYSKTVSERKSVMNNNPLGETLHPPKSDLSTPRNDELLKAIDEWNIRSHRGEGNWSPRCIYSKNVSFMPNILNGKISLKDVGIKSFEGDKILFNDNTSEVFDSIVLCTGYLPDYSIGNIQIEDGDVRNLYKHFIVPEHEGTAAIIGMVRPFSGGIPMIAEMQARYFALLCNRKVKLPTDLNAAIEKEKKWEETWTSLSPSHKEAIPSQIMYCDAIAREIGCLPKVLKLIFNPRLMVKYWFYTFNQACYRLIGPHSDYKTALRHILDEELPLGSEETIFLLSLFQLLPYHKHPKNSNAQKY